MALRKLPHSKRDSNCSWLVSLQFLLFEVTLFEKSNFCPRFQFWQNFTFRECFTGNHKSYHLHFHEFFAQNIFDNFSREVKVVFSVSRIFSLKNWNHFCEFKAEFLGENWRFGTVWRSKVVLHNISYRLASLLLTKSWSSLVKLELSHAKRPIILSSATSSSRS